MDGGERDWVRIGCGWKMKGSKTGRTGVDGGADGRWRGARLDGGEDGR